MKENIFKKNIHSMLIILLNILIQENEGIAQFFMLMFKGPFEQSYGVYNTYITLEYLQSLWNLEGYCIAIVKLKVPSKTFFGSSLKQDVYYKRFFLQLHSCLQQGCKDESFEEEG